MNWFNGRRQLISSSLTRAGALHLMAVFCPCQVVIHLGFFFPFSFQWTYRNFNLTITIINCNKSLAHHSVIPKACTFSRLLAVKKNTPVLPCRYIFLTSTAASPMSKWSQNLCNDISSFRNNEVSCGVKEHTSQKQAQNPLFTLMIRRPFIRSYSNPMLFSTHSHQLP